MPPHELTKQLLFLFGCLEVTLADCGSSPFWVLPHPAAPGLFFPGLQQELLPITAPSSPLLQPGGVPSSFTDLLFIHSYPEPSVPQSDVSCAAAGSPTPWGCSRSSPLPHVTAAKCGPAVAFWSSYRGWDVMLGGHQEHPQQ